jgi:preprotein translocase subunit SecD
VLDDIVWSAPTINATDFNGRAQISGTFDLATFAELVAMLSSGVLPVDAQVLSLCAAGSECLVPSVTPDASIAA